MVNALLSMPTLSGCLIFMTLTSALGLSACFLMFYLVMRRQSDAAIQEIREATSNLLRVVGWAFCLLLSLTFTEVVGELFAIETSIEGEAAAITDVHHNLDRFGTEHTNSAHALLAEYTESVIDHDWPALADDRLSERSETLLRQLEDAVIRLEPTGFVEQRLWALVAADIDRISDDRLTRLQQAQEKPPSSLIVVLFGYVITTVCFGVYRPRFVTVGLISLYTMFISVVIYMIFSMSDPFQGATPIDPTPLQYALEAMRTQTG